MIRTFILSKEIKSAKNHEAILHKDEEVTISWPDKERAEICLVSNGKNTVNLKTENLPKYFDEIEMPSDEELEDMIHDSICLSVFGNDIEPDGWDHEGSPSWLMAMGIV